MSKEEFIIELKKLNFDITNEIMDKLNIYYNLLIEWNNKFNLTRIIEEKEVYLKHYYDSLMLLKIVDLNLDKKLLDIGTGAGFPGMILALCFPKLKVYLLESNSKKCEFLKIVRDELQLQNVIIINERAEEHGRKNRETYDFVTCRAVSHLNTIIELAIPLLKVNGFFIPLKSSAEEEIKETKNKINKIGAKITDKIEFFLPVENSKRTILLIQKTRTTDLQYPREYNKIIKDLKKS